MTDKREKQEQPLPEDFLQDLMSSYKKEYSEEEVVEKQNKWQRFEDKKNSSKNIYDFPDYFYTGFWIRLWAFLIDLLCIHAISSISVELFLKLFPLSSRGGVFSVYGLLSLAVYLGYFVLMTKMNHGQTVGKMIFGIRVISLTEEELSWETILVREAAGRFILQFHPLFMFGYLTAAFNNKKQHVADYFSETSVVTINMIKAFNKQAQV